MSNAEAAPIDNRAATLARRLCSLRLARGWNMDRVALAARISRTTLFHLERGTIARPRASTLHKLACLFDVPVESLHLDDHEPPDPGRASLPFAARGTSRAQESAQPPHDNRPSTQTGSAAARAFDRATNPVVTQVAADDPALFAHWSDDEWDELYSQFATGGALREEGVRQTAARINHDRETLYRLRVLLQTHLAEVAAGMVDTLYKLVSLEPDEPSDGPGSIDNSR